MIRGENVIDAKERSKEVALKNASMQAAVFVESVLEVDSGMVSEDEITVITSNVLQLQKEPEYTNIADGKSFIIRCHVVALIDTDSVEKIINNRELVRQMEQDTKQIKEDRDRLMKEVEYWKDLYKNATSDSERGKKLYYTEKYSEAVVEYSKQSNR